MTNVPPKSAIELAMERLEREDAEAGINTPSLTNQQISAIADAKRSYEAQVAECRILHESAMLTTFEPNARAELEANYRRDLSRAASDRDSKIEKIRKSGETDTNASLPTKS